MHLEGLRLLARGASLFLLMVLLLIDARSQCVDSSEVNDFKVRSVTLKTLFGAIPNELRKRLESHRSEAYSADRASAYLNEIKTFYSTDPAQAKYERLIANKLKLSVKAGKTWLDCVKKVDPYECQKTLPGTSECVDVTIKRYSVDVDALDSSPYFLLFPRSALAVLYGAIPRPLLALNPALSANEDKSFGPAASIDTATDLLDLGRIFGTEPDKTPGPSSQSSATPTGAAGNLEVTFPGAESSAATLSTTNSEEPALDLDNKDLKLLLRLKGRKALARDFYDTSTVLSLTRTNAVDLAQGLSLEARFDARNVPLGDANFFSNAVTVGFSTDLRPKTIAVRLVNMSARFRWSRNQLFLLDDSLPPRINSENGFAARVVADATVAHGLTRGALWFDGGELNHNRGSYRRLAALVGYGKDFVISRKKDFHQIAPPELSEPCWTSYPDPTGPGGARKNQSTVGLEVLAGAGHAWGDVPEYARFYGGSMPGQFLYDELSAQSLTTFPAGPLIRSIGQSRAGFVPAPGFPTVGGTSYWHANVNLSVPVPVWSRPLIPHEWVTLSPLRAGDEDFQGHVPNGAKICRDLKSVVKTLVQISGVNLLVNQQARDLLTDAERNDIRLRNKEPKTPEEELRLQAAEKKLEEAKARVRPEVEGLFRREILPITNFIADHANTIAVKPLLMFDVAHLALTSPHDKITRYGLGGGLQIDLVLARFEVGYLATMKRAPGDPSGSFVGRIVLRRFF
jgi:hypothetical protein